ncbi:MAG: sulfite exporter TauE/SafE family protein [Bacteroidales bacterium]|nr:sulfite exporter TauE/SafE family protein [Bacteroidales bacterium]
MSISIFLILVISGLFVGFINTLSAGGTAISIALYLALGLSPAQANATNRIGVLLQSSLTSVLFSRKGFLKNTHFFRLALPTMSGALVGAILSLVLPEILFSYFMGISLLVMIVFLFRSPKKFEEDDFSKTENGISFLQYLTFFLIGIYGGFVQVGTGFLLMSAGSMLLGYNIIKTNALKTTVMAFYTVIAVLIFWQDGSIHWQYGLLHSIGTFIGSFIATKLAFKKGAKFIKWVVIFVIIFTSLYLFKIIDLKHFFQFLIV